MAASVLGGILIADEVVDLLIPVLFYKVRLKITGSAQEVNEFQAVGIDPLLVFRDKDYRKLPLFEKRED